ncbi:MAG: VOC family protein [Saccharothrix sp.]|nr:VOC family protein [Saccharothrix sp.]
MTVTKILSVVPVDDFDTSVAWYERLLGRHPDARPMAGLADWHLTATAWVQVYRDRERAGHTYLNFAVDDLAAHATDLASRGITLGEVTTTQKNAKLATTTDPDGNTITFVENPST